MDARWIPKVPVEIWQHRVTGRVAKRRCCVVIEVNHRVFLFLMLILMLVLVLVLVLILMLVIVGDSGDRPHQTLATHSENSSRVVAGLRFRFGTMRNCFSS